MKNGGHVTFYSVENFRSKLQVVDNLLSAKFRDHPAFEDWPDLLERCRQTSSGRNTIVHHRLIADPKAKPGRRYGLQPVLPDFKNPPKIKRKRPAGTLCIRDIAILQSRFVLLSNALHNFAARLRGLPVPLPKSSEQDAHRRSLEHLRRQIHELCGHPLRSSRR
jgi:hypothetical protein